MKKHINVHPGEVLREEFLRPFGITPSNLAREAKLSRGLINDVVEERGSITARTDLHLCAYFGQTPGYWLRIQLAHDLRDAAHSIGAKVKATIRPFGRSGLR